MNIPCHRSFAWAIPGIKDKSQLASMVRLVVDQDAIITGVCRYFKITHDDLVNRIQKPGKRKSWGGERISNIRQVTQYLLYENGQMTLAAIAAVFGVHHTTIIYSREVVEAHITPGADNFYKISVREIKNSLWHYHIANRSSRKRGPNGLNSEKK